MVVILVHWLIKIDCVSAFEEKWQTMTVDANSGLYREILTTPDNHPDDRYHTFSLESPNYKTYINIGIWASTEHFDKAIGKYIPEALPDEEQKVTIKLEHFEYKLRERIVLKKIQDRGGNLPIADLAWL